MAKMSERRSFRYKGIDKSGREVAGTIEAASIVVAKSLLRGKGISVKSIGARRQWGAGSVNDKDISAFTRQLATMMKSGVPLLAAFDIVMRGAAKPAVRDLMADMRGRIEQGGSLSEAFAAHPLLFDKLYCALVAAGEEGGILETLLDRIAQYKEKMLAIKSKIKSALFYPTAVIIVAAIVVSVIMIFVVPEFKKVFASFGADLPAPTQVVIGISDYFVDNWYVIFGAAGAGMFALGQVHRRSETLRDALDRFYLHLPVFGELIQKAALARWSRTLATLYTAGVPLVDALESVEGAAGNVVYRKATAQVRHATREGIALTNALQKARVFPTMLVQMVSIGEESGEIDSMLNKLADGYEQEVDDMVAGLSQMMEPMIMVFLGTIIGALVVAMYLPIFKMGQVV